MNTKEKEKKYFLQTYNRLEQEIEYGEGVWLYTKSGEKYLDMFAGLAVNILGYNNPAVTEAITDQLKKFNHLSNYFLQDTQIEFAENLLRLSGFDKLFLTSSGTESVEAALKLTRKYANPLGKNEIISFKGGFHGRTYGALSLTYKEKYREGYEPLLPGVKFLTHNNEEELIKAVNEKTAAVILEFIQGEGGLSTVSESYVNTLEELKHKFNFLIIADCIQCGAGRTGKFLSIQHYKTSPDICVIAKGIGGGLPLGAVLVKDHLKDVIKAGEHGTTFGGNPVSCAAGIAVMKELENGVMQNANVMGEYLRKELVQLQSEYPEIIKDIRGIGLMLGVEVEDEFAKSLMKNFAEKNIFVNITNNNVLRLIPPLIISKEDIDYFITAFGSILESFK